MTTNAWEVTSGDVAIVLSMHRIPFTAGTLQQLHSKLDTEAIERIVLDYTVFDDQVDASLNAIEDQLIETGDITTGHKKCHLPE